MALKLALTDRQQEMLAEEAARVGMSIGDYCVMRLVGGSASGVGTEEERLAAIDACIGALADVPFSSADYAKEKQEEIDRGERRFGLVPARKP
jgi:hypothetical protein